MIFEYDRMSHIPYEYHNTAYIFPFTNGNVILNGFTCLETFDNLFKCSKTIFNAHCDLLDFKKYLIDAKSSKLRLFFINGIRLDYIKEINNYLKSYDLPKLKITKTSVSFKGLDSQILNFGVPITKDNYQIVNNVIRALRITMCPGGSNYIRDATKSEILNCLITKKEKIEEIRKLEVKREERRIENEIANKEFRKNLNKHTEKNNTEEDSLIWSDPVVRTPEPTPESSERIIESMSLRNVTFNSQMVMGHRHLFSEVNIDPYRNQVVNPYINLNNDNGQDVAGEMVRNSNNIPIDQQQERR